VCLISIRLWLTFADVDDDILVSHLQDDWSKVLIGNGLKVNRLMLWWYVESRRAA